MKISLNFKKERCYNFIPFWLGALRMSVWGFLVKRSSLATWQAVSGLSPVIIVVCKKIRLKMDKKKKSVNNHTKNIGWWFWIQQLWVCILSTGSRCINEVSNVFFWNIAKVNSIETYKYKNYHHIDVFDNQITVKMFSDQNFLASPISRPR